MKRTKHITYTLIALIVLMHVLVFCSCSPTKELTRTKTSSDSTLTAVKTEITAQDCTVVKPAVKTALQLPLVVDTAGKVKEQSATVITGNSETKAWIKDNVIYVQTSCEEAISFWKYRAFKSDSLLKHQAVKTDTEYVVRVSVEYRTPWYNWVAFTLLVLIIIYLLTRLFNPFNLLKKII